MAEIGLNFITCILIFQTGCSIPLPGLETHALTSDVSAKVLYENDLTEGSGALSKPTTTALPPLASSTVLKDTDLTSILQHMSAIQFLRLLAFGSGNSINREALKQALHSNSEAGNQATISRESTVAQSIQPNSHILSSGQPTGQQQQTYQSNNQQTQKRPGYNNANGHTHTGNIGNAPSASAQGERTPGHIGVQTPNQVPKGQYYSLQKQQQPPPPEASMSPNSMAAHLSQGQMMLGIGMGTGYQPNMFNHAQQYTNPVYMLTGGMTQRTNGNGPPAVNAKEKVPEVPQPAMTGHAVFNPNKLMDSLLSSDSSSFNPDKFTASQSYVSTNEWSSPYAGKPTGYSGMFVKDDKNKPESGQSEGHRPTEELNAMQQQMSQTQYNAKMNFVPNNMMMPGGSPVDPENLKFSFDPDKINQFLGTFKPGQIAPSVEGPKSESSEHIEGITKKPTHGMEKERGKFHSDKKGTNQQESGAHAQQEQTQSHKTQRLQFNTNQGNFAQLDSMPNYFMGNFGGSNPFYFHTDDEQNDQTQDDHSVDFFPGRLFASRQNRSAKERDSSKELSAKYVMEALMDNMKLFEKLFKHDVANQEQVEEKKKQVPINSDSHQNSTILNSTETSVPSSTVQPTPTTAQVTTTLPSSTTVTQLSNITTTASTSTKSKANQPDPATGGFNPDAVNAGQAHQGGAPVSMFGYGNPASFNPNTANTGTGFNPAMSPGMTASAFSGMQFGQLGPKRVNSSSNIDPFGIHMNANFNPSKFNTVHMNFDMNAQLGITGKTNGSPSVTQGFSGGYDPIQTNIMAMQNPFTPGSVNGSSSNTVMTPYGGGSNAFIKPFNPNALNEALFGKIEPGTSNNTNGGGGGDFSSFYLGVGGSSGFGGSFDPSMVNNAVFNPDEVNKIRIHFDPSEMLERNPGYDKNVATSFNFDPNKVNAMQSQNLVPPFLGHDQRPSFTGNSNKTKAESFGQPNEFLPGLLSGGGNQGIKFDPNRYNNVTLQMSPMSQTNQIQGFINPANNSLSFDPTAVNNMQINYNPYQTIGGNNLDHSSLTGNGVQAPPSGQVQEFNTNHAVPMNNVPKMQGGNKESTQ